MTCGRRFLGILSCVSMMIVAGLHAVPQSVNVEQDFILIDSARIQAQSEQWQDFFEHQELKRYAAATSTILLVTGLVGFYLWTSNNSQKQVQSSSDNAFVGDSQVQAKERLWELYLDRWQKERTWGYRLSNAFGDGVDRAVTIAIASFCVASLTGAGSWAWDKIKEHLGFAQEIRFKALMRDYTIDASRLLYTLKSFFKAGVSGEINADLSARLAEQKMYGLLIDARAFVLTIERFLGFVVAIVNRGDLGGAQHDDVQRSLDRFVTLANDILVRQKEMVNNAAEHAVCLGLIQGVCEEGMRLMTTVGTLLYGKEFNVPQEA